LTINRMEWNQEGIPIAGGDGFKRPTMLPMVGRKRLAGAIAKDYPGASLRMPADKSRA
jgi:hypothetical protein